MTRFPFRLIGSILLIWGIANTSLDVLRYGAELGSYWWFCNLAMIGMAIALLTKSRGLLSGFLAIACFTQVFWLIDNVYRQLTQKSLFGLVDFMYRPGYPVDEFLLSHYHYFTIPIAVIALFFLPQRKSATLKFIAVLNPLIFGISYFVFPAELNVNCIHRACFPGLELSGPKYALAFWASIYVAHLIMGSLVEKFYLNVKITPALQKLALKGFAALVIVGSGFALHDTAYKISLPSFDCASPTEISGMTLGCKYTRAFDKEKFLLVYYAKNNGYEDKYCKVSLKLNDKTKVVSEGMVIEAISTAVQTVTLESPAVATKAQWVANCQSLKPVTTASYQP